MTPYLTPHIPHIQVRDMREELTLLAYAPSCEASPGAMPGLPMARTGFWLSAAPPSWTQSPSLMRGLTKPRTIATSMAGTL